MHWAVEVNIPFWAKEKGGRGLVFQKESRQVTGKKERASGQQILSGLPRNNRAQREVQQAEFVRFLPLPRSVYIMVLR